MKSNALYTPRPICYETNDCLLIHGLGLPTTYTSIQRSKANFYVATLRSFNNYAKIINNLNVYILL
jgi:hypothetical protein